MARDWHWWLVTWGTYGSWLPGDERGFRTWRKREYVPPPVGYSESGEPTYDPRPYRERLRRAERITGAPVFLDASEQQAALDAIVQDLADLHVEPHILAVTATHLHLLATFGEVAIRSTVGRLKSRATKALKMLRPNIIAVRVWTKGCHMRSLETDDARMNAWEYVRRHESEGLIHVWHNPPKPTAPPSEERKNV